MPLFLIEGKMQTVICPKVLQLPTKIRGVILKIQQHSLKCLMEKGVKYENHNSDYVLCTIARYVLRSEYKYSTLN
jgi:hypothetical protein